MRTQLLKYWDQIRTSFWFLPSLMAAGAVGLSFATVALDESLKDKWLQTLGWKFTSQSEGASAVLQTIAGSMITIAGVVFSLTLVALSLASSQFGPRLLRNFMRDTTNQLVLGTFVATFLYCLLVLRTIRHGESVAFVPHLSITLGVVFALASLWVLIYFIHHVSVSIQADEIVARVGEELNQEIERLFPQQAGEPGALDPIEDADLPEGFERDARAVGATGDGYLQIIDGEALMEIAAAGKLLLRVERRPGHYVVKGGALVSVWPGTGLSDEIAGHVANCFILGSQRTPTQDIEFAINQLVEIAARALSPGVNDPFTAMTCVDRLGSALSRLAQREMANVNERDEDGRLWVIIPSATFEGVVDTAFHQIRQYSRTSTALAIRLLETITVIAEATRRPEDRMVLQRHADMISRGAHAGLPEIEDKRAVQQCYETASRALRDPAHAAGEA